tara:strand:+ start:1345 stop:2070 length:726 start_codon:yes stop_codon:yes gene_type:complete
MKTWIKLILKKEYFYPSFFIGIWINPFFIIRRGLMKGVQKISKKFHGGKLLDVGCGSKPYEKMFHVNNYIGIDIETSGHNHNNSKIDKFYDGKNIPFDDLEFDYVFSSEVLEHVFNLDELLCEINRVLKKGGKFGFTCPFVWDEHEQPYDYARYTSFAIKHLLKKHGFKLVQFIKSTGYFETVMQMLSSYVYLLLPRNRYFRFILIPIFIAPINIIGVMLNAILPKKDNFYHNNIVVAQKI